MAALTELDVLRTEHKLLSEMNLNSIYDSEEIQVVFMQIAGISVMADELLNELEQKPGVV